MKKNNSTLFYLLALFMCWLVCGSILFAVPDVLVDLRLYEAAREKENKKPSVVTSYYLRPIASAYTILDADLSAEKEELLKIFNLDGIQLMSQAKWAWKTGTDKKQFQLVVLDGHKIFVQLTLLEKKDHFKLEVFEEGSGKEKKDDKKNLETVMIVPQGMTSVFGFEDNSGKPYFLSFQRHADSPTLDDEPYPIAGINKPKLLRKIRPEYPIEALKARVEGQVVADVTTDVYGRVNNIVKVVGHPLLIDSTIDALKQWVYEPYILNKVPRAVKFTVVVSYNLRKDEKEAEDQGLAVKVAGKENKPVLIKKVKPVYPEIAKKKKVEGTVILESIIDIQGNVKTITKVSGHPLLIPAAIQAVKQWKYKPFLVKGQAKDALFIVAIKFDLEEKKNK